MGRKAKSYLCSQGCSWPLVEEGLKWLWCEMACYWGFMVHDRAKAGPRFSYPAENTGSSSVCPVWYTPLGSSVLLSPFGGGDGWAQQVAFALLTCGSSATSFCFSGYLSTRQNDLGIISEPESWSLVGVRWRERSISIRGGFGGCSCWGDFASGQRTDQPHWGGREGDVSGKQNAAQERMKQSDWWEGS